MEQSQEPGDDTSDPDDVPALLEQPAQTPLFRATQSARYHRQEAIGRIEKVLQQRLICVVAGCDALITRSDIAFFADLVHDLNRDEDLHLMISCTGGDVDAAYRVGSVIRAAVGKGRITTVIPSSATSGATLLALVGDRLLMSDTSELSPIDPLVLLPSAGTAPLRRPALAYLQAFDDAIIYASNPDHPQREQWAAIAQDFDQAALVTCRQAVARTRDYADKLLQAGMFRDGGGPSLSSWTQVTSNLMTRSRFSGHGLVIPHGEAKTIGLDVDYLPRTDNLWQAFWRLYCEQQSILDANDTLFEGSRVSLHRPGAD